MPSSYSRRRLISIRKGMDGAARITRIVDAGGETLGEFEPVLNLAQNQQVAVEAGDNLVSIDR